MPVLPISVPLSAGKCRECGGRLEITDATDDTMTVDCTNPKCADSYEVEVDAFGDGGVTYWPEAYAAALERGAGDDEPAE